MNARQRRQKRRRLVSKPSRTNVLPGQSPHLPSAWIETGMGWHLPAVPLRASRLGILSLDEVTLNTVMLQQSQRLTIHPRPSH